MISGWFLRKTVWLKHRHEMIWYDDPYWYFFSRVEASNQTLFHEDMLFFPNQHLNFTLCQGSLPLESYRCGIPAVWDRLFSGALWESWQDCHVHQAFQACDSAMCAGPYTYLYWTGDRLNDVKWDLTGVSMDTEHMYRIVNMCSSFLFPRDLWRHMQHIAHSKSWLVLED